MLRFLILFGALFLGCGLLRATNYYTTGGGNGNYNNNPSWTPSAPPTTVPVGDTLFIDHTITLSSNTTINGVVIISSTGTLNGNKVTTIGTDGYFSNAGNVDLDKAIYNDGTFINTGVLYNQKHFYNLSNGHLNNSNSFTINVDIDNSGAVENTGDMIANKKYLNNSNSSTTNSGSISAGNDFSNSAIVTNSGSISTDEEFLNNTDATLQNYGTIITVKDFDNDGTIVNTSSITVGANFNNRNIYQATGNLTVTVDINNTSSIQSTGDITVSTGDFFNDGTLQNSGNIGVTGNFESTVSVQNSGFINADAIFDSGNTCNSGNMQVTQGNLYNCPSCTISCGGSITVCTVSLGSTSNISNQNFCCQDNSDTQFATSPGFNIDSATVFVCGAPLPIELLSFIGWPTEEGNNHIQWVTATEMDNDYFLLEKSLDGITWTLVEKVQGAGFSTNTLYYNAMDKNASFGKSYYRLLQVDFNGETHPYGPISVDQKYSKNNLICYPNPANNQLFVLFNTQLEISEIQLKNAEGKEVISNYRLTTLSDQKITIDLSQLASGIYFLYYRGEVHRIIKI